MASPRPFSQTTEELPAQFFWSVRMGVGPLVQSETPLLSHLFVASSISSVHLPPEYDPGAWSFLVPVLSSLPSTAFPHEHIPFYDMATFYSPARWTLPTAASLSPLGECGKLPPSPFGMSDSFDYHSFTF